MVKVLIACLAFLSITNANPIVNSGNVNDFVKSVSLSIYVNGKPQAAKLSVDAAYIVGSSVNLVQPKLVVETNHYGIELNLKSPAAHLKATTMIADHICSKFGKKVVKKDGVVNALTYTSLFPSLEVSIKGTNAYLIFDATTSPAGKSILNSISCL